MYEVTVMAHYISRDELEVDQTIVMRVLVI